MIRKAHEMYQCPLCPTRLQTEDNWRKHMQLHVESGGYNGDISTMMPVKETLIPQEYLCKIKGQYRLLSCF